MNWSMEKTAVRFRTATEQWRPACDQATLSFEWGSGIDAILYVLKGGIPWRQLPTNYPPWKTVYHVFRGWTLDTTWAVLNDALRVCVRRDDRRHDQPTAAILDSQSLKSDGHGGEVGYDAGKRIK